MISSRKCPRCGFHHGEPFSECPRCGIVLYKYARRNVDPEFLARRNTVARGSSLWLLFFHPPQMSRAGWLARALLIGLLGVWGLMLAAGAPGDNLAGDSVLHLVNLPFHEAGHLVFAPLGRLAGAMGGTLMQLLVPLLCGAALLWQRSDSFGAAVCLWWLGENFLDIAPYINDARSGTLPLLGGVTGREAPYGYHDWEFILNELGLLKLDHSLALASHLFGAGLMGLGVAWGLFLLYRHSHHEEFA
jgi:hypothetical protein